MTLLAAIPSDRALDRNDFPEALNAISPMPEYMPGPWTPAKYSDVPAGGMRPGWCLAFGFMTGYWTTTGPAAAGLHMEEYAGGWTASGYSDCIITFNYVGSHEVFSPNVQLWQTLPNATAWRSYVGFGGNSDINDFAAAFVLQWETP